MADEQKILDIDSVLGKAKNRIYRIGIELEGGWRELVKGMALIHDGSVSIPAPRGFPGFVIGEFVSEPLEVEKFPAWIRKFYPSDINDSCGLHVHLSFESALHYQRLMEPFYQDTIIEYLRKWGKKEGIPKNDFFYTRLTGTYEHCQKQFWPDLQVAVNRKDYSKTKAGHRYTVINYCYGLHETIECRVLPMFPTVERGVSAVQEVVNITNAVLAKTPTRERRFRADVSGDSNGYVELTDVRI